MKTIGPDMAKVFLQTGDCFIGVQPTVVTTVLGSCLAVTIHAPKMGIGTICHAFLPDSSTSRHQGPEPQICRFVDTALQNMLETMDKIGVPRRELCIKMFGGGQGVAVNNMEPSGSYNIGRRNIEMAKKLLKFARLDIQAQDVGGSQGRKLMFNTQTGDVWVKKLNKSQLAAAGNSGSPGSKF